jgi:hypothetical protein
MKQLAKIEQALRTGPALEIEEFQSILEYLIGRTARSITDSQIEDAFKKALAIWQR